MTTPEVRFSVVKGDPTEEELAALVTVLALHTPSGAGGPMPPQSGWSAYRRTGRTPITPGPDAWRMSARPQ